MASRILRMKRGRNQKKVFLSEKLIISLSTSIERVHCIGQYTAGTTQPLIVKFLLFKNKQ